MDYTKLFDLFVKKRDGFLVWMEKPFLNEADGNVWATDGAAAVIVAMDVAGLQYDKLDKKLQLPIELPTEKHLRIPSYKLLMAIDKCPKEEIMEEKKVECKECDGEGTVLWEYDASSDNKRYEQEYECPVCEGDGYIYKEVGSGKFEPAQKSGVRIGDAVFSAWQLDRVYKAMALLDLDELVIATEPHRGRVTIFRLGDIKVLQMPMYTDEQNKVIVDL